MKKLDIVLSLLILILLGLVFLTYNHIQFIINQSDLEISTSRDLVTTNNAYISGAITNPGVYEIDSNTTLLELIKRAGGFTANTDTNYIEENMNLAKIVNSEDSYYIREKNKTSTIDSSNLININSASSAELITLPGIGEATSTKIINARPFSSITDLLEVDGIGEKTLEKIEPLLNL